MKNTNPNEITFDLPYYEEVMKISAGKFYWKGEEVEDANQVYERFNEWLTKAEVTKNAE